VAAAHRQDKAHGRNTDNQAAEAPQTRRFFMAVHSDTN